MNVRDELAELVRAVVAGNCFDGDRDGRVTWQIEAMLDILAEEIPEAVLEYFAVDPDCDPELIAAHLKADRARRNTVEVVVTADTSQATAALERLAEQADRIVSHALRARIAELEADNLALIDLLGDTDD